MNKLSTIIVGLAFFIFATFTGTSAFAAPSVDCSAIGHPLYANDSGFSKKLDTDGDGIICENAGANTLPANGGSQPNTGTPGQVRDANGKVIPQYGQVDTNGKPVQRDSNGNPVKTDANGKTATPDNLATTGANGMIMWGGIGLLALAVGAFMLYAKRHNA